MVRKLTLLAGLAALTGAAVPAGAHAAPGASSQAPSDVTSSSAHLRGKVNPGGKSTTYSFQYGTSTAYGGTTPAASAGSGKVAVGVAADITGLKANTRYHFRLVASNPDGVRATGDRSFVTTKVPLSLSLAATPNPAPYGSAVTLNGVLAGTDGGGRTVKLQQKAFPYTAGFVDAPLSPVVTGKDGTFSLVLAGLLQNAQVRVVTTTGKSLASAPVLVGIAPIVRTAVTTHHPRRGTFVRFAGTVTPAFVPAQVAIQRQDTHGAWITIAGVITKSDGPSRSRYAKSAKITHAGNYRVFVGLLNSQFAGATGSQIRISPRSK